MEIIKFNEAEKYEPQPNWIRHSLCNKPDISIEHFIKPPKHASPHHNHPNAQILYVIQGKLTVRTDINEKTLEVGDTAYIPCDEFHTVSNPLNQVSIGLDIFVPGRAFDFWLNRKINP